MYLTLEQTKKHLNIEDDFTEDDDYIISLILVAEDSVRVNLDVELCDIEITAGQLPPAVTHAMLLMVANLYANREPVSYGTYTRLPLSYEYLIALYKNYNHKSKLGNSGFTSELIDELLQKLDDLSWMIETTESNSEDIDNLKIELNALKSQVIGLMDWVNDSFQPKGDYLTQHQPLDNYYTKSQIDNKGYLTQHQPLSDYARLADIPTYQTVPMVVTFEDDSTATYNILIS